MEQIGIIRKLDELGRIVIPREFRKSHRINVGDPLSIVALENGDILIKRVDVTGDLMSFGAVAAEVLRGEFGKTVLYCTSEEIKGGSGRVDSTFYGKPLDEEMKKAVKARKSYAVNNTLGFAYCFASPIMSVEEVFGAMILLSQEEITAEERQITDTIGKFIGNLVQIY